MRNKVYDLKETNIDALKKTAKFLLEFEPEPDKQFGWQIVHHPIITNVLQGYVDENKSKDEPPELLDIREPENLKKIKSQYKWLIDNKCNSAGSFFQIINKPYTGIFFKLVKDFLDKKDYTMMLRILWTYMEYPNSDRNVTKTEFISYWKHVDTEYIYDEEDKKLVEELPEEFTVYRGLMEDAKVEALSWTLDLDRAIWFAKRWNRHGKVYKAKAKKKDMLVYLSDRNESEIVIDYHNLTDIEEVEYE